MVAGTSTGPQQRLDFGYDWRGRRIMKKVWNNTEGTGAPSVDRLFAYDGWNLISELGPLSTVHRSFAWGLDLSGSLQGPGGVGGLLWVNDPSTINSQPSTHLVSFDGNGNVVALFNTIESLETARYEYGPFGEVIRMTGQLCPSNPFRFSTKYQDDETDLLYYGYRYYNSGTGRWLSRDPMDEQGFRTLRKGKSTTVWQIPLNKREDGNLSAFLRNSPLNDIDFLGLCDTTGTNCPCGKNVTHLVYQTLQNIGDTYVAAPWYQKLLAQQMMFGPPAIWSWDIRYLFHYDDSSNPCQECRHAVTFEGICVHANELNYIMWGYAMILCEMDLPEDRLNQLELALQIRGGIVGEPLDVVGRKVGFAAYGAQIYPTLPQWLVWPHDCSPMTEALNEDYQDWRWTGLKNAPF